MYAACILHVKFALLDARVCNVLSYWTLEAGSFGVVSSERGTARSNFAFPSMEQVVECSPHDLSIGSVLAKATPQLGPYRQCTGGGSLRDFLRHGIAPAKRFFEPDDAATRPAKRKKGDQSRDFVEVYAEGDWCVSVCLHACV